jgi:hypothetical protein
LPFMSYGRSSQVISLLGTGILINVGRLRGSPRAAGPRERRKESAGHRGSGTEAKPERRNSRQASGRLAGRSRG